MEKILFVILFFLATNVMASDYHYDVSGHGDSGYVYGKIGANIGNRNVVGYLYDESGNGVYFEGELLGYGKIEGYDAHGEYIELEID